MSGARIPPVRAVVLDREAIPPRAGYPFTLPALAGLERLELDPGVTILTGENGSGKSTLVEAIAVAAGLHVEGGSPHAQRETRHEADLASALRLEHDLPLPRSRYFLRAESFFNVADAIDAVAGDKPWLLDRYGGRPLHAQSHGESFLNLVVNRFEPGGFYVLDEPEAALSPRGCLALIARVHDLVREGAQLVLATHSPILVGFPGALVYRLSDDGIERIDWDESDPVVLTRRFLADRDGMLRHLIGD